MRQSLRGALTPGAKVLFAYIDGGPDHNNNFVLVCLSWLAFLAKTGVQLLVVGRTPPAGSCRIQLNAEWAC
jgi:hypothetical protein